MYAIVIPVVVTIINADRSPSVAVLVPVFVCGVAGLAMGVAAWVLSLKRAGMSNHRAWGAVIGFGTLAGGLPGFLATVAYAIAGPPTSRPRPRRRHEPEVRQPAGEES
jgi:hypothetical protein